MGNKNRLLLIAALAIVVLVTVLGLSRKTPQQTAATSGPETSKGGIARISIMSLPTIDPQLFNASQSYVVIKGFGEGLIRTFNGKVQPGVAERWEIAGDNKTMTFYLRQDACWSDGTPLTAHDFVYAFRRLADQKTGADYRWVLSEIVNGEAIAYGDNPPPLEELGVKALDDHTVEISFHTPAPYYLSFLDMPCFYPTKRELVEQYGDKYASSAATILGNGPFKVVEYLVDQSVTMEPNENYWDAGSIKLGGVSIVIMEPEAAYALAETGELDMTLNVPLDMAPRYIEDPSLLPEGVAMETFASGAVDWFCINIASKSNAILGNKDFRLALNYALDREEYIKVSSAGLYAPATRFVLPLVSGVKDYYADEHPMDVYKTTAEQDKAKEHMAKAMAAMGVTDPSQISFTVTISDITPKAIAENVQDQWQRNLGVKVNVETVTYKAMLANRTASKFDLIYASWMPDFDDPYTYLSYFVSSNSQNGGKYSNKRYDYLVNNANGFADPAERLAMYAEAEKLLLLEAGIVPLQMRQVPYAYNKSFKNCARFYLGSDIDYTYAYFE